jgi:hypothetical protein
MTGWYARKEIAGQRLFFRHPRRWKKNEKEMDSFYRNVLFDDCASVRNCHPYYKMQIFNPWGGVAYESEDIYL